MKSKVYLIRVTDGEGVPAVAVKLKRLLEESRMLDFIRLGSKVAVKMHFGEEGNTGFVKPEYLRVICEKISAKGAKAFAADTNTLYKGRRTNSADHLALAAEHGFTRNAIGAEVVVPDDTQKENTMDVQINQKFIKTAKLARFFVDTDAILDVSHFKGHIMTGFGGALKNLGMGCAARVGKLQQHADVSPVVYLDRCTGCGECEKACPVKAITIENEKSVINAAKCIGCATCIAVCPFSAIDVPWESGGATIQDKMIEYASAVMKNKKGKIGFLNFAIKITKECDCLAKDDPRVAPDIGILASIDPVSIDKASFDLVNQACSRDIFKELHPERDGTRQLKYAQELGLGNLDYELIEVK
ncbi:MAG: DUF362 domain-containing protein [Candidatus Omnitrophica bacterium]|nr:DUF362 domain-containing protein [Candidatus Omnitrophota bacterium]